MPKSPSSSAKSKPGDQTHEGGLGRLFASPIKKRNDKKSATISQPLGYSFRRAHLLAAIQAIDSGALKPPGATTSPKEDRNEQLSDCDVEMEPGEALDAMEPVAMDVVASEDNAGQPSGASRPAREYKTDKDQAFANWKMIVPVLVVPYLNYIADTMGRRLVEPEAYRTSCQASICPRKTGTFVGLHADRWESHEIVSCRCESAAVVMIRGGMFPCSPVAPRMAVDINLLALYRAQWEKACEAVTALSSSLHIHYSRRGFSLLNAKGQPMQDAFRKGLGNAMLWFDSLIGHVEDLIQASVRLAEDTARSVLLEGNVNATQNNQPFQMATLETGTAASSAPMPAPSERIQPAVSECDWLLRRLCPLCFGGAKYGTPVSEGCDVHVSIDGNFNHRHVRSAGNCPQFYEAKLYISKDYVDDVGKRIDDVRKRPAKKTKGKVPKEAIDECENGHVAGVGTNVKTNMDKYDDTGTMALVCRHDIPLFLANIDTPGEQQKYAVALIQKLFSLLPSSTTVAVFYDVGCVLDRSLERYDILPSDITSRLLFATSAMHAYTHQWACQLVYNPRLRESLGLSDGEGTERLWSQLRKLIGVCRQSARNRRIWLIDRLSISIGAEMRERLGEWIRRRLSKVKKVRNDAQESLKASGVPVKELRELWKDQQEKQTSIRAFHQATLTKELESVLKLHEDIEQLTVSAEQLISEYAKGPPSEAAKLVTKHLQDLLKPKYEQIAAIYASLSIDSSLPEFKGLPYDFVRNIVLSHALKINIRKRAIASFFEWDRLRQSSGGRDQALGTNLHQLTRKSIAKRQPALQTAIKKFNSLTAELALLNKPEYRIPTPRALPTKVGELRNPESGLWEDVWVTASPEQEVPRWLSSADVRDGIRAMLQIDRCQEELRRLGREADNLVHWYGRELIGIEVAILEQQGPGVSIQLQDYRSYLRQMKGRWGTTLASEARFDGKITEAKEVASRLGGTEEHKPITWAPVYLPNELAYDVLQEQELQLEVEEAGGQNRGGGSESLESDADDEWDDGPTGDAEDDKGAAPAFQWSISLPLVKVDGDFLAALHFPQEVKDRSHTRRSIVVRHVDRNRRVDFDPSCLARLARPQEQLNDVCINSCSAMLQQCLSQVPSPFSDFARSCALFSSFDLERSQHGTAWADIWRQTGHLQYWSKGLWIFPIHRRRPVEHWAVGAVNPAHRSIQIFDSIADHESCKNDAHDLVVLLDALLTVAIADGHTAPGDLRRQWEAFPVVTLPIQASPNSCGMWALAQIASLLRGYQMTGLKEIDIETFKHWLYMVILCLPVEEAYASPLE